MILEIKYKYSVFSPKIEYKEKLGLFYKER